MAGQHGNGHEHGAAGRNGHIEGPAAQTVQAPGAREVNAGQYPQEDIEPNQEYRLAPQVGQLDAGTCPTGSNTGYRVDPVDLDVGYIQAPVLPPGGAGVNPERASGESTLLLFIAVAKTRSETAVFPTGISQRKFLNPEIVKTKV